jgi:hypothetical protein
MLGGILGIEGSGHLAEAIVLLRPLLHLLAGRHLRLHRGGVSHILSSAGPWCSPADSSNKTSCF